MSEVDTGVLVSTQHRPERAAHESIRGYVHQATLTALEWLHAGESEVLVCEGNEDVDRLIYDANGNFREISEHQVKAIGGNVTARTPAVHESIFNFLRSFHVHDGAGRRCRFTFSTTAAKTKQRAAKEPKTALDTTDVLERWTARAQKGNADDPTLVSAIKALVERYLPKPKVPSSRANADAESAEEEESLATSSKVAEIHSTAVQDALAYVDADLARWTQFLDSVQWSFKEPTLSRLEEQLVSNLASDPRTQALPHALLSKRLVAQVLSASAKEDVEERTLTRTEFDTVVRASTSELQAWAERTRATAFFTKLLEHEARIARIEHDIYYKQNGLPTPGLAAVDISSYIIETKRFLTANVVASRRLVNATQNVIDIAINGHTVKFEASRIYQIIGSGGRGKTSLLRILALNALLVDGPGNQVPICVRATDASGDILMAAARQFAGIPELASRRIFCEWLAQTPSLMLRARECGSRPVNPPLPVA